MANEPIVHLSDRRDFIASLRLEAITQNSCGRNAGSNLGDTRRTSRFSPHDEMGLFIGFAEVAVLGGPCKSKLVTRAGQRFESARRLSFFSCFSVNLREETDLYTLNGELVGMARETMQPSHIPL